MTPPVTTNAWQAHIEQIRNEWQIMLRQAPVPADVLADWLLDEGTRGCGLLLLLAGEVAGAEGELLVRAAASTELFASALELHDRAARRPAGSRGVPLPPTLDPVLIGDFLYVRALSQVARLPGTVFQTFAELSEQLVDAKLRVKGGDHVIGLSELGYLEQVYSKSAALFATCCRMGAELGQPEPQVIEALTAYGYSLGMALQMCEDLQELHTSRLRWPATAHDLDPERTLDLARSYVLKARASLSGLPASLPKCLLLDYANALLEPMD